MKFFLIVFTALILFSCNDKPVDGDGKNAKTVKGSADDKDEVKPRNDKSKNVKVSEKGKAKGKPSKNKKIITMEMKEGRLNYSFGHEVGVEVQKLNIKFDYPIIEKAMRRAHTGKELDVDEAGVKKAVDEFYKHMNVKRRVPSYAIPEAVASQYFYIQGYNLYNMYNETFDNFTVSLFIEGFNIGLYKKFPTIDEAEMLKLRTDYHKKLFKKISDENTAEEKKYFDKLKADKKSYKSTKSGLMYKVIKSGKGQAANKSRTVKVKYEGRYIDGKVFDASPEGKPIPVDMIKLGVINGWKEALKLMKQGDKWELSVPFKLAYGANPHPRMRMQPCKTLIFIMEVIEAK